MTDSQEKPRIIPDEVRVGRDVRRRPCGRGCQVTKISDDRTKVLIRDGNLSRWVKMATLVEKWF